MGRVLSRYFWSWRRGSLQGCRARRKAEEEAETPERWHAVTDSLRPKKIVSFERVRHGSARDYVIKESLGFVAEFQAEEEDGGSGGDSSSSSSSGGGVQARSTVLRLRSTFPSLARLPFKLVQPF